MNRIRIHNRQRLHRLDGTALRELGTALLRRAARLNKACVGLGVDLLLVDDAGSASINAATLGHAGPTDVITLPYDALPGLPDEASAEIVLNVECARRLGKTLAGADRELALYLAHACDHLCGFDDQTLAARRSMRRREWRWLAQTGIPVIFTR